MPELLERMAKQGVVPPLVLMLMSTEELHQSASIGALRTLAHCGAWDTSLLHHCTAHAPALLARRDELRRH